MEDDLKKKWKTTLKKNKSQFLLYLGANLSWDWLSSLRFFSYMLARLIKLNKCQILFIPVLYTPNQSDVLLKYKHKCIQS